MKKISIALDGPSGAGKSTLAKRIAAKLGIVYLDTGALYRTVGLHIKNCGVDPKNAKEVEKKLDDLTVDAKIVDGAQQVFLNGENVSSAIRTPEMSMYASAVSAHPAVRSFLLEMQRDFAKRSSVIMDGRDIGSVVLPYADVKIWLTARDEVRAKRRYDELILKGEKVTYDEVLSDIIKRDAADSSRVAAPAVKAEDAILLDNSELDFDETVSEAIKIIEDKTK